MPKLTILFILPLAVALAGCSSGSATRAPAPNLVGQRLDVAEDTLDTAGLRYETIGGGTFGIVVRSHWTVCRQAPKPNTETGTVTLTVGRTCVAATPLVVPDVIDAELDDAREKLEVAGFVVVAESVEGNPIVVESLWTVCDQSPEPGYRGKTVVLTAAHDCWDNS